MRLSRRSGAVTLRLRYELSRTWFTCLEVPPGSSDEIDSWRDQQRFMYLRIRRLVGSFNEHHLEMVHYEKECELVGKAKSALPPPKQPTWSTYSGIVHCFFLFLLEHLSIQFCRIKLFKSYKKKTKINEIKGKTVLPITVWNKFDRKFVSWTRKLCT